MGDQFQNYRTVKELAAEAGVTVEALTCVLNTDPFSTAVMIDGTAKWDAVEAVEAVCRFANKMIPLMPREAERPVKYIETQLPLPLTDEEPCSAQKPRKKKTWKRLTPERLEKIERLTRAELEVNPKVTKVAIAERIGENPTAVGNSRAWKESRKRAG